MTRSKFSKFLKSETAFIILFVLFSILAINFPYYRVDLFITKTIQSVDSKMFGNFMWAVSTIGNQPIMFFVVGISSAIIFFLKYRKEAIISSIAAAGSALIGSLIKVLVDRPRPTSELVNVSVWLSDKSYPSNHVLVFTVYFGFLLYLLLRGSKHNLKWIILSVLFTLLISSIGISRIYLGAHWASDVLGGYLLGTICLLLTIKIYNSYHGQR